MLAVTAVQIRKIGSAAVDPRRGHSRWLRRIHMETTIYMPLLNEGTDVWRPVKAEELGDGCYRVAGSQCDEEEWAFPTGAIVIIDAGRRIVSVVNA